MVYSHQLTNTSQYNNNVRKTSQSSSWYLVPCNKILRRFLVLFMLSLYIQLYQFDRGIHAFRAMPSLRQRRNTHCTQTALSYCTTPLTHGDNLTLRPYDIRLLRPYSTRTDHYDIPLYRTSHRGSGRGDGCRPCGTGCHPSPAVGRGTGAKR